MTTKELYSSIGVSGYAIRAVGEKAEYFIFGWRPRCRVTGVRNAVTGM